MTSYRIYMLDPTGRTLTASDADCGSDARAFAWANITLGDDARAEIWQGARRVGRVWSASRGMLGAGRASPPALLHAEWPANGGLRRAGAAAKQGGHKR